jgi:hypothetical protein
MNYHLTLFKDIESRGHLNTQRRLKDSKISDEDKIKEWLQTP